MRKEAFGAFYARSLRIVCLLWGRFEVAFQTRWQANIIINAPGTDGDALRAPLLELDTINGVKFGVN